MISPNVCRVFDLVELDGQELVSMEYIDGTTLVQILQSRGPLELQEAREIASQFLAGLEAIHQAGLVHRDLKPENIMITRSGRVVVMDFGIAKGLADQKNRHGLGNSRLHGTGAGAGRRSRCPCGCLLGRCGSGRDDRTERYQNLHSTRSDLAGDPSRAAGASGLSLGVGSNKSGGTGSPNSAIPVPRH